MNAIEVVEFVNQWEVPGGGGIATPLQMIGSHGSAVAHLFGRTLRRILTNGVEYLFSPFSLLCFGMAFILNRTIVYATTRVPIELSLARRFMIRATAIFTLLVNVPTVVRFLHKPEHMDRMLWDMHWSVCLSYFIELFSAVIQRKEPNFDGGFSLFEYSTIFQDALMAQPASTKIGVMCTEIGVLCLLSIVAQLYVHVEGIANTDRFRLVPSTLVGLSFTVYFVWVCYTGKILQCPTILVFGSCRYIPQLLGIFIVGCCWAIYTLAACVVGRQQLNMHSSYDALRINMSDNFFRCVVKLCIESLATSQASYLEHGVAVRAPVSSWLDMPVCPYDIEVDGPPPQEKSGAFADDHPVQGFVQLYDRIKIMLMIAAGYAALLYRKALGRNIKQRLSERHMLQLRIEEYLSALAFEELDADEPGAHLKLLAGADLVDIDNSPDYALVEESDYDESDASTDSDLALCTENVMEIALDPNGGELITRHLRGSGPVTRSHFLSVQPSEARLQAVMASRRKHTYASTSSCVVCLENARNIILWPCRCLALCDECRSALSIKLFTECVCCRQRVQSYSRIYQP